jgi:glycosyltransferase involved in cell wall biosynthesis
VQDIVEASPDANVDLAASGQKSLTVAIPAFNEEAEIGNTIETVLGSAARVPELRVEILVVDDGSQDRTAEIVDEIALRHDNVRLLRNPGNMGLGTSIRRAIESATGARFIIIPGDNDIPEATLDLLFANAYAADLVMTYFHNDECRGRARYLVSETFRLIYTSIFNLYVIYINGPAIYPTAQLRSIQLRATRFSIVAEMNVRLLRQGLTFIELPSERRQGMGGSTSASFRNLVETARVFLHLLMDVHILERKKYSRSPSRVPYQISSLILRLPNQVGAGIDA